MSNSQFVSFRAKSDDVDVMDQLAAHLGLSRSSAIKFVVRQAAREQGILAARFRVETAALQTNRAAGDLKSKKAPPKGVNS